VFNLNAVSPVASIFILLLVGYASRKLRILSVKDTGIIDSIVINLALPAFIFTSIHGKPLYIDMLKAPVISIAAQIIVLGAAYLIGRLLRLNRPTIGALMIASAFGNTGYLGLPFVTAVFDGNKAAIQSAVMIDSIGMRPLLCTVGVSVATCFAGQKFDWRNMLEFIKTPLLPALLIGLALRSVYIPDPIMKAVTFMGAATVPLSMLSVGLNLSTGSAKKWPIAISTAVVLKLAALPAIIYFGLPLFGIEHTVAKTAVLEMAMPSAIFGGVIAGRYGANKEFVAGAIFVSTLLSVVAIPTVLAILASSFA